MRVTAALLTCFFVAACGGGEEAAPVTEEAAPAAAEVQPAGPTVADFAGTWQLSAVVEGTPDPVPVTLEGSADGSDWTMVLEGRDPISVEVSINGDSLIVQSAEYESVLRAGVMVTVRTAGVMEDGGMVGTMLATYRTEAGEEQVPGTLEGMRGGM
jgi:hypothetical protein